MMETSWNMIGHFLEYDGNFLEHDGNFMKHDRNFMEHDGIFKEHGENFIPDFKLHKISCKQPFRLDQPLWLQIVLTLPKIILFVSYKSKEILLLLLNEDRRLDRKLEDDII